MKILHVIDSEGLYGAEVMLLNLAIEQTKLNLHPVIASIGDHHSIDKLLELEARRNKLDVETFRMRNGPNLLGAYRILRYARNNMFDVIHTHGYKGDIILGLIPKSIRGIPIISTLHGWTNTSFLSRMRIYENIHVLSLRFLDAVVVVNRSMLTNKRLRSVDKRNLYVVQNGISQQYFPAGDRDEEIVGFCSKRFTIVSLGRLSKEKGYECLIRSFDCALKKGIDASLLILGNGPERTTLETLVNELRLQDRIFMPGFRNNAKGYLAYCDLFVLSSLTEGLPITLLEAMQAGTPIIATSVGGIPDVLENGCNGILLKSGNIEEMSNALVDLYNDDKKREDLAEKAKHHVNIEYSSEKMARKYYQIYKERSLCC